MLQLIIGRAGSGKSAYIYRRIGELIGQDKPVILMVPEQFTLENEREVLRCFGNRLGQRVQVLNFSRLANLVLLKTGGLAREYIDAGGKCILMHGALEAMAVGLRVYGAAAGRPEFVGKLLKLVTECKTYDISPQQMYDAAEQAGRPQLSDKLRDLALLYGAYEGSLSDRFADSLDDMALACEALGKTALFSGHHVFFDSFQGFTPQELRMVEALLGQAERVTVSLCCESLSPQGDDGRLFSHIKRMAQVLIRMAKRLDVPVEPAVTLSQSDAYPPDIAYLERYLYNYSVQTPGPACRNIRVFCAADVFSEMEEAARQILRLVREEGLRYRDVVIVTRDMESYGGVLELVLTKYGIPLFMDRRTELTAKPLMTAVFSAFDICTYQYRGEDVFRYLKTGLAGLPQAELDLLEHYAYQWDIKGSLWLKDEPWEMNPDGYVEELSDRGREALERVNRARDLVMAPLRRFAKATGNADARGISKAVYELLLELRVPEQIGRITQELADAGRLELAAEYAQLWDLLMGILDQMAMACRPGRMPRERYAELLKLVAAQYDIGKIPTTLDEVLVGSADRMRTHGAKAVFIIGFAEGDFPQTSFEEGLLTDTDRERLMELSLELAPTTAERLFQEQFYLYCAFTAASQRVFVSYPQADMQGKVKRPSYMLERLKTLLPDIPVVYESAAAAGGPDRIEGLQPAFEYLLAAPEGDPVKIALSRYFDEKRDFSTRREQIRLSLSAAGVNRLGGEAARGLYGDCIRVSPTSLDRFQNCRFSFFCRYGLRVKEWRQLSFDAPEVGNFIHYVLERYVLGADRTLLTLPELRGARRERVETVTRDYVQRVLRSLDERSPRFVYLFSRLSSTICTLAEKLAQELSQSLFTPLDFELPLSEGEGIPPFEVQTDGSALRIVGKADRIDGYEKNGRLWLRVVDYKTGPKEFAFTDVYHGINLQMLIYLFSVWEKGEARYGRPVEPAGILYAPVQDPVVRVDRGVSDEEIERLRGEQLRMNGLLLSDMELLRAMEPGLGGRFIPVRLRKDGGYTAASSVASLERFRGLRRHVERVLREMSRRVAAGEIDVNPFTEGHDSCRYCEMHPVCRFEAAYSRGRRYFSVDREAFWQRLGEGGEEDGNQMDK